ncbi:MAG: zinc-ribbon domain-containing protein [Oscillospiraceae bacterium]|jgi:uncharacterized Zn finger protein (UPF0148 family)
MDKYCGNCGHPLSDGAKFCANCGQRVNVKNENQPVPAESKKEPEKPKKEKQPAPAESKKEPVKAKNEEQDIATESKEEPVKTNAIVTKLQGIAKKKEGGFIAKLVGELIDFIQHPKKLLPTIVLTVFWTVFPILSAFGANIPVLRFLYTLTYSNGGMFGGLFGAVGGIFGKAVFAAVVNTIILSLIEKKNPFADGVKSLKQVFSKASFSGLSAISPFLIGAGTGLVLYWFFNITSSPVNCAVSVVAAVGAFSALGKKNGMLTSLVYFATGKLTKGKFPTQITVNRTITGFSAGFALGLPLTFVRFGWLLFLVGAIILGTGVTFAILGKKGVKKMAATAAIFILTSAMMLPMFYTNVFATGENLPDGYVPMDQVFRLEDGDGSQPIHYTKVDGFYLVLSHMASDPVRYENGNAVYGVDPVLTDDNRTASQTISDKPSFTVTHTEDATGFTVSGTYDWKLTHTGEQYNEGDNELFRSDLTLTISNITFKDTQVYADINGRLNANAGKNGVYDDPKSYELVGTRVEGKYVFDAENDIVHISFYVNSPDSRNTGASLYFRIDGVLPKKTTTSGRSSTAITQDDPDYKPYRGYLTYTNGEKNKHGQPFPDLMDFDDDGEITWLDVAIQKELSHNPDWLDLPASKGAAAALAVITALLGAAGGALSGPLSSILGSMAQAASSAAEGAVSGVSGSLEVAEQKEDLGPYIRRDPDGDLEVNDPATGEKRVYVANGNGTYTNPLTGATYTPDELKASLESRAEHAEQIRQDEARHQAAIEEHRAVNQEKSQMAIQAEAENAAERAREEEEARHKEYVAKLAEKYDFPAHEETLYEWIATKKGKEEIKFHEHMGDEEAWKESQEYAEKVKKTADVAIDIYAEIDPKTGKAFKNAYTVATAAASNMGDVMAGNKSIGGAIVQTAVDSGVELAKNYSDGAAQKMFTNTVGDSIKVMSDTYMKGGSLEKIREEGEKAAIQGAINATVDTVFDTFGDGVTEKLGLSGKDGVGSVLGKEITKETVGNIAKTVANTAAKDVVTFEDEDEAKLARLRAAQEQAEAEANAQAAQSFRKAQENGFERDWRESLPPDIRYKVDLAAKYGVFSGDDEELYQKIAEQQGQEEIRGYEHREIEKEWKEGQEHLERVKKGADVAFDIYAEVGGEAGKAAKDAYTAATAAASNMGDVMAGNKTVGGAIAQTVVDTGVELAKNHAEGTAQKLYTNIVGDGMKAMSDTYMKGGSTEDIQNAGKSAAIQGGINVVEGVADKVGGKVTEKIGLSGEDVFATVGGKDIAKDAVGDVAKTIANTAAKDMATLADQDEVDLENLQEAQEQAEAAANAQAAQSFREAQEKWSENNDDDAGEDGK